MNRSEEEAVARSEKSPAPTSAPLWIGVGVVFVLMALAWTAMFFFASKHRAADVPLAPRVAR